MVQISLDATIDQDSMEDFALKAEEFGYHTDECADRPEQTIARSTWTHQRILEARHTVIEFECLRMYGMSCEQVTESTQLVSTWDELADSSWPWRLKFAGGRKSVDLNQEVHDTGTLGHCWGDPSDGFDNVSQETGGDCSDDNMGANRDMLEGPGDLLGLFRIARGLFDLFG